MNTCTKLAIYYTFIWIFDVYFVLLYTLIYCNFIHCTLTFNVNAKSRSDCLLLIWRFRHVHALLTTGRFSDKWKCSDVSWNMQEVWTTCSVTRIIGINVLFLFQPHGLKLLFSFANSHNMILMIFFQIDAIIVIVYKFIWWVLSAWVNTKLFLNSLYKKYVLNIHTGRYRWRSIPRSSCS